MAEITVRITTNTEFIERLRQKKERLERQLAEMVDTKTSHQLGRRRSQIKTLHRQATLSPAAASAD